MTPPPPAPARATRRVIVSPLGRLRPAPAWLLVALLILVDSLHYVFARLLAPHLPPTSSGFWVMVLSTLEVLVVARGRIRLDAFRAQAGFFLAIGFLVAVSTVLGYAAMRLIDPGTASLLSRMSVVFGLGFGLVWLRDRLRPLEIGGAALAVGGVLGLTFQPGDYLRLGSLMVLAGSFLYALHAALVKQLGGRAGFLDFFFFRLATTTAFLLAFGLLHGTLVWPSGQAWLLLLVTATVDTVISRSLYYLALRELDMSLHTLVLTLSPVVTLGWSLLLFGVRPSIREAIAGAGILAGVAVVTASRAGARRAG